MKRAIVYVDPEVIEALGVIHDHGLSIVASMDSDRGHALKFVVEGDALPDECARGPLVEVHVSLTTEVYGKQRIHRVSEIRLAASGAGVRGVSK